MTPCRQCNLKLINSHTHYISYNNNNYFVLYKNLKIYQKIRINKKRIKCSRWLKLLPDSWLLGRCGISSSSDNIFDFQSTRSWYSCTARIWEREKEGREWQRERDREREAQMRERQIEISERHRVKEKARERYETQTRTQKKR